MGAQVARADRRLGVGIDDEVGVRTGLEPSTTLILSSPPMNGIIVVTPP